MTFQDWILGKFDEWEKAQPKRQNYTAFARYLGVKQATFNAWINAGTIPSYEKAGNIAEKLGDEVYAILGYEAPGGTLDAFPERLRDALLSARDTIISRGLVGDSPEAAQIVIEAMSAAGYKLILTDNSESAK